MARVLDPAVEATIREALADPTASYTDIAAKVGRSASTIRYHAEKWGLARNVHKRITDERREKIRRMLRAGCWTYQQIADGAGCSRDSVRDEARGMGITSDARKPVHFRREPEP